VEIIAILGEFAEYLDPQNIFTRHASRQQLALLRPNVAPRKARGHHPSDCIRRGVQNECARCLNAMIKKQIDPAVEQLKRKRRVSPPPADESRTPHRSVGRRGAGGMLKADGRLRTRSKPQLDDHEPETFSELLRSALNDDSGSSILRSPVGQSGHTTSSTSNQIDADAEADVWGLLALRHADMPPGNHRGAQSYPPTRHQRQPELVSTAAATERAPSTHPEYNEVDESMPGADVWGDVSSPSAADALGLL
jgi:hypothetical protein